jgi:hypothetical protein
MFEVSEESQRDLAGSEAPNKGVGFRLEGELSIGGKRLTGLEWRPGARTPKWSQQTVFPQSGAIAIKIEDDLGRSLTYRFRKDDRVEVVWYDPRAGEQEFAVSSYEF